MPRRPSLVLVGLACLLAAGCGGKHEAAPTTAPRPTVSTPRQRIPAGHLVSFTVVDGDTGAVLPRATITAGGRTGGHRRRVAAAARWLRVTARAPRYEAKTLLLPVGRPRVLTIRLYRPDGQWLMYGVTPARTQSHPGIALRPPFRVVWGRELGALLEFPAVVDDGVAYLTNLHGMLFALSMADGRTLWQRDLHTWEQDSSPAVVGGWIVDHTKSGNVVVVDRRSGKLLWRWQASGGIESSPVVLDGTDYLGDWAGDVYALDLVHRRLRWVYHDGCKITASATVVGGAVYLGDYCGRVLALSRASGRLAWSASAGSPVYGTAAAAGGRLFVPSRDAGALYAFTTGGSSLWSVSTGGLVYSAPAAWGGRVYFGSYTGVLYCVSASSGRVLWTLDVGGPISGSPTVIDGVVYAGSFGHRIVGADARTGRVLFRFPHGEYVAVSGNRGRLLLYGWSSVWAVEPRR